MKHQIQIIRTIVKMILQTSLSQKISFF